MELRLRAADFDFALPDSAVARYPAERRTDSRLLVLDRASGAITHRRFAELPELLAGGDLLVTNDTRVLPARLTATKPTGGKVELLLVAPVGDGRWRAMATGAKRLRPGMALTLVDGRQVTIDASEGGGFVIVALPESAEPLCEAVGRMPLPPYLGRDAEPLDRERYQTVFAKLEGARSVAAPTAGLHFDDAMLASLRSAGVERAAITLDVGPGTFLPVRTDRLEDHEMHEERFAVPEAAATAIRAATGRTIAVGTTVMRTLETLETIEAGEGATRLFISPGFAFRHVDAMITNFHLPRSTLLMLVCAFAGTEAVLAAYAEAVNDGYRFYSYGDAMLVI